MTAQWTDWVLPHKFKWTAESLIYCKLLNLRHSNHINNNLFVICIAHRRITHVQTQFYASLVYRFKLWHLLLDHFIPRVAGKLHVKGNMAQFSQYQFTSLINSHHYLLYLFGSQAKTKDTGAYKWPQSIKQQYNTQWKVKWKIIKWKEEQYIYTYISKIKFDFMMRL